MTMPRNPIQQRRESLGLGRTEFAEKAEMRLENLLMVEGGANILLSRPVATKLARVFEQSTPEELIEEYAAWRRSVEVDVEKRSEEPEDPSGEARTPPAPA